MKTTSVKIYRSHLGLTNVDFREGIKGVSNIEVYAETHEVCIYFKNKDKQTFTGLPYEVTEKAVSPFLTFIYQTNAGTYERYLSRDKDEAVEAIKSLDIVELSPIFCSEDETFYSETEGWMAIEEIDMQSATSKSKKEEIDEYFEKVDARIWAIIDRLLPSKASQPEVIYNRPMKEFKISWPSNDRTQIESFKSELRSEFSYIGVDDKESYQITVWITK